LRFLCAASVPGDALFTDLVRQNRHKTGQQVDKIREESPTAAIQTSSALKLCA